MRKRLRAAGAGRKRLVLGCNCPSSSQEETAVSRWLPVPFCVWWGRFSLWYRQRPCTKGFIETGYAATQVETWNLFKTCV